MIENKVTFCRICEALCGMIATVEDGKLVGLAPDPDNPYSKGFACVKGTSGHLFQNDPDRLASPLKRVGGPGSFEPISWDQALDEIATRLTSLRDRHGSHAVALNMGNAAFMGYQAAIWVQGFKQALGTPWFYIANTEDFASRLAATAILYGRPAAVTTLPDYRRTDLMLMLGANPWVSKGSLLSDPRIKDHLKEVVDRGGRVVVVDPRRTETARQFEHIAVQPGTDPWFLLSLLEVLFTENLCDEAFLARWASGLTEFRRRVAQYPPEATAEITGVDPGVVREIARAIGAARSVAVYGRTGTCTQLFGTLTNILQDTVAIVTGNLQVPGGTVFGWSPTRIMELAEKVGAATYDETHSRVARLPDGLGALPSNAMTDDIMVPGEGQVRALISIGANPLLSSPDGAALRKALESLELMVSVDPYLSDTAMLAHYVLPCTTLYEREDVPFTFLDRFLRPTLQVTEPVVEPWGDVRPEWQILNDIAHRMGLGGAYTNPVLRWLAKIGITVKPRLLADVLIRTSRVGDWFGLRRGGWSWRKLRTRAPHGQLLHEHLPIGPLADHIRTPDGRIPLADPRLVSELDRLAAHDPRPTPEFPLRLIGMRETRSHNTWLHNIEKLMPADRRHTLRMNPDDAASFGVQDGCRVVVASKTSAVTVEVTLTPEMVRGAVALPHGWGHDGGWKHANAAGGVNSNLLASRLPEDLERLAAMTVLSGIPVRAAPAVQAPDPPDPAPAARSTAPT